MFAVAVVNPLLRHLHPQLPSSVRAGIRKPTVPISMPEPIHAMRRETYRESFDLSAR